jgi:hypothetical protein
VNAYATTHKPAKMVPAFPRGAAPLLRAVIEAGQTVNPRVSGLTHVTPTHAVLQAKGDPTYYMVEVSPEQAAALGYVSLR